MFLNKPKIGLAEQPSSAAKALAVRPDSPTRFVTSKAAFVISDLVNLNFGGTVFPPAFAVKTLVVQHSFLIVHTAVEKSSRYANFQKLK